MGHCNCNRQTSGRTCSTFCPKGCSGNGVCVHGECLCASHFHGMDCSIFRAPNVSPAARTVPHRQAVNAAKADEVHDDANVSEFTRMLAQAIRQESGANDNGVESMVEEAEGTGSKEGDYEGMLREALLADGVLV